MLTIDGSLGEGGGQVLRTSLALAAVTGTPVRFERIRAKRNKPGLLRQHLTAVKAIAQVCGARLEGAELGSQSLRFEPGTVKHGEFEFAVGTAGSATLVFQTILPPLLTAAGSSRIIIEGGTHNPLAPPFDFLAQSFLPLLQRMGAAVSAKLIRPGFYPAGGGRIEIEVSGGRGLVPLELLTRGELQRVRIQAVVSQLPMRIARREVKVLAERLMDLPIEVETKSVESAGPGNVVTVTLQSAALTETFSAFGELGVPAEKVAERLAGVVRKYLAHDAPVGEHLADQLMLPLALAGAGAFRTLQPSLHAHTHAQVIEQFLPVRVGLEADGRDHVVRILPRSVPTS